MDEIDLREDSSEPSGEQPAWRPAKLMGIDLGLARIGVAVCDPLGLVARPLIVLHRRSRNQDFEALAKLATAEAVEAVVCGLPLNMDGSESAQTTTTRKWAMRFAQALRVLLGRPLPLIFWDERLSSYAAREIIASTGLDVGEDAAAAAVILQAYLDAQRRGEAQDFGRIDLPPRALP